MAKVDLELFREPSEEAEERAGVHHAPKVIAVSGAKGGVGKTLVATNIAVYLATIGRRVVVVDADATGANAHGFLGAQHPQGVAPYEPPQPRFYGEDMPPPPAPSAPVSTAALQEPTDVRPKPVDVGLPGLRLWHAGLDEPLPGTDARFPRSKLPELVRDLEADFVVVDLGTGISPSLLDAWLDADLRLFVTLPEPTAVEGTYRFVRASFSRMFERKLRIEGRLGDLTMLLGHGASPTPPDLAERLGDHPMADEVRAMMPEYELLFVMNQARIRADLQLGSAMVSAARRRLGIHLHYAGYIDYDDSVWNSLRAARPLLVESPGTKSSRAIEKIARTWLSLDAGKRRGAPVPSAPPHSHHDLLEVDRGATEDEVRRAYKRCRELYSDASLATVGLFDADGLSRLRARVEEAHDVLLDPARRRPYELSVFSPSDAQQPAETELDLAEAPRPPAPTITP